MSNIMYEQSQVVEHPHLHILGTPVIMRLTMLEMTKATTASAPEALKSSERIASAADTLNLLLVSRHRGPPRHCNCVCPRLGPRAIRPTFGSRIRGGTESGSRLSHVLPLGGRALGQAMQWTPFACCARRLLASIPIV